MATTVTTNVRPSSLAFLDSKQSVKSVEIDGNDQPSETTVQFFQPKVPTELALPSLRRNDDQVRIVSLAHYKEAALCLAEAFATDHVARYFIDTPDRVHWTEQQKWGLHVKIMEYLTYAHCLKGLVTTTGPNYGSVALWMPPGEDMDDLLTVFRSGMWRLNFELSAEGKKRFFNEFVPLLHDTKAAAMGDRDHNSWYLVWIGTKPSARGKGYAGKLIRHVLDQADRHGQPCYLESSNLANLQLYARYGFESRKKIYLQRAEQPVELDVMVREPKPKPTTHA